MKFLQITVLISIILSVDNPVSHKLNEISDKISINHNNNHHINKLSSQKILKHPMLSSNIANYLNKLQVVYSGQMQSCSYLHYTFRCWGSNLNGEADLNASYQKDQIISASIGRHQVCTIHNSEQSETNRQTEEYGDLYCFGSNEQNQTDVPESLSSGLTTDTIKAGDQHTCAIGKEESLCWGLNDHGQLEIPDEKKSLVAAVSVRWLSTCIISNSVILCFGKFKQEYFQDNYTFLRFAMIYLGQNHVCYNLNQVICEGDNEFGQLEMPNRNGIILSMGTQGDHSCGSDQISGYPKIVCWGKNDQGQTNIANLTIRDFSFSTVGDRHSCFVKGKTQVECIGTDELGLNQVPHQIKNNIHTIDTGGKFTCANIGGILKCQGKGKDKLNLVPPNHLQNSFDISTGFSHVCSSFVKFGENSEWACWSAKPKDNPVLQPPSILDHEQFMNNWMSSGFKFTCITVKYLHDPAVCHAMCWGINDQGQLDIPVPFTSSAEEQIISAGIAHACGSTTDMRLFCWGRNDKGQATVPSPMMQNVQMVTCGQQHTCAVNSADVGVCWGHNNKGQTDVPGHARKGVLQISGGGDFSCGLKLGSVQRLVCWGGSGVEKVPKQQASGLSRIRAGQNHACLLTESGNAKCWGDDEFGQSSWHEG